MYSSLHSCSSLFRTNAAVSEEIRGGKFKLKRIGKRIAYYYSPSPGSGEQATCPAKDSQTSTSLDPISCSSTLPFRDVSSADPSSPLLLSDSPSRTPASSQSQSHCASTSRPLLVFFSWLHAQPGSVTKYRDLYLDRGMDVLVVQSSVMYFLWPRWGLDYGLEVLKVLEEPQFLERVVLIHATSIGGFTFTQVLHHVTQAPETHVGLNQRVIGHIYDSLVIGSLEHMAIGLGKSLVPALECFIKNAAMLYFWLFKTHTADMYERSIQLFHNSPITAPAFFFFSENDPLCNSSALEKLIDLWKERGVAVESRKWKESTHAAHLRCHPDDYLSALEKFLTSLPISYLKAKM
uniref:uncharacterized protein LOC109959832 isoform X2 n=1 Tax=Monopterus albus TaxID=43700 RepID=UPI0009B397EE|nr:uncharacterized protein LOC109959832 isoform X2 [Monopterus albus]XP_020455184.1 uncharacterized protein LOC109959832 isoform X2 [Monopterus albus]XP_020455185.1 uncharacterized protein LOC109959832 isoform X2 [Monopterus albus]XP_020455186.1 uncharacterized protein LOC109959832 isoform X2 [Monopterus albus]